MMGYYSATITEYSAEETLLIMLRGQTISIDAVEVVYDRTEALRVRKKNLRYFEKEFLGSEYNARKCHILNEEVIQFSNNKGDSLFDAFAYEPIVIHNEALGYTLIYHLDSFAKNREQVHYQGVYYFIEDEFKTNRSNRRALKRRTAAFEGSRMHFVRSLYDDQLNEAGFLICDTTGKALERNDIIIDQNQNTAFISGNRALEYYYYPDKNNILSFSANFLKMQTDQVLISKEGYFDPIQCAWGGRTTKERVGMLLPFGYKPDH